MFELFKFYGRKQRSRRKKEAIQDDFAEAYGHVDIKGLIDAVEDPVLRNSYRTAQTILNGSVEKISAEQIIDARNYLIELLEKRDFPHSEEKEIGFIDELTSVFEKKPLDSDLYRQKLGVGIGLGNEASWEGIRDKIISDDQDWGRVGTPISLTEGSYGLVPILEHIKADKDPSKMVNELLDAYDFHTTGHTGITDDVMEDIFNKVRGTPIDDSVHFKFQYDSFVNDILPLFGVEGLDNALLFFDDMPESRQVFRSILRKINDGTYNERDADELIELYDAEIVERDHKNIIGNIMGGLLNVENRVINAASSASLAPAPEDLELRVSGLEPSNQSLFEVLGNIRSAQQKYVEDIGIMASLYKDDFTKEAVERAVNGNYGWTQEKKSLMLKVDKAIREERDLEVLNLNGLKRVYSIVEELGQLMEGSLIDYVEEIPVLASIYQEDFSHSAVTRVLGRKFMFNRGKRDSLAQVDESFRKGTYNLSEMPREDLQDLYESLGEIGELMDGRKHSGDASHESRSFGLDKVLGFTGREKKAEWVEKAHVPGRYNPLMTGIIKAFGDRKAMVDYKFRVDNERNRKNAERLARQY